MITPKLVSWQWENYPLAHGNRTNLIIHALTEPLFLAGLGLLSIGIVLRRAELIAIGAVLPIIVMAAQGWGHKQEEQPPAPFRSPLDVVARIFVEQLVTFPRFVLSGGFGHAWSRSNTP